MKEGKIGGIGGKKEMAKMRERGIWHPLHDAIWDEGERRRGVINRR